MSFDGSLYKPPPHVTNMFEPVMDRRSFLRGIVATAAIAAVVGEVLTEPLPSPLSIQEKKPLLATARVECGPGIIHMDGVAVKTGDCILVEYQTDPANDGVYVVKAVHNDSEVTLAIVHENREVRMHRDKLEPFINKDIQVGMNRVLYYPENVQRALGHPVAVPSRPRRTWPQPRRRRGRS